MTRGSEKKNDTGVDRLLNIGGYDISLTFSLIKFSSVGPVFVVKLQSLRLRDGIEVCEPSRERICDSFQQCRRFDANNCLVERLHTQIFLQFFHLPAVPFQR